MAPASLTASLLARKGTAKPAPLLPSSFAVSSPSLVYENTPTNREPLPVDKGNVVSSWEKPEIEAPKPTSASPKAAKKPRTKSIKTVRKTVTIPADVDKELRVLAAARGVSQQQVLAEILSDHLHQIYASEGCMCGAKHHR